MKESERLHFLVCTVPNLIDKSLGLKRRDLSSTRLLGFAVGFIQICKTYLTSSAVRRVIEYYPVIDDRIYID